MKFFALPRQLWWSHRLAFLLHDYLAEVVERGDQVGLFNIRFPFANSEESESLNNVEDGAILEWLHQHGKGEIADAVIERTLVRGVLSDMCQFLFESIQSAAKGKVGVAFALLRKPFRDELFILEWILSDAKQFLREFRKGPEAIDICQLLGQGFVRQTMTRAVASSAYEEFVDFEMMWQLRFDKSVDWSLERVWNQAIHLVTTHKHYRTENENLNFAFIQQADRADLVEQFYRCVPMVLLHACGVVKAIVERWEPAFVCAGRLFDMRVVANCELWLAETGGPETEGFAVNTINEMLQVLKIPCANCAKELRLAPNRALESFVHDSLICCSECGHFDEQLASIDEEIDEETTE